MMTIVRTCALFAGAMLVLSACGTEPESTALPSPGSAPDSSATATAESTGAPSEAREEYAEVPTDLTLSEGEKEAAREALVAVDEYFAYYMELTSDPSKGDEQLGDFASDQAEQTIKDAVGELRDADERTEGDIAIRDRLVTALDLDTSDDTQIPFVSLDACVDVSGIDVLNAEGDSVVAADGPTATMESFVVARYDDAWLVSRHEITGEEC